MAVRYKDFLRNDLKRLETKLNESNDPSVNYNIKRQMGIIKKRINKDVRMSGFGVEI